MTKKILITGINGFIGSNCRKFFEQKNYDVYGIDITGSEYKNVRIGYITESIIKSFEQDFDYIIHLAGSGTVSMAQQTPEEEKRKSIDSCVEVLEYIKNNNTTAKMIFSSSAAVYGNAYSKPISEDDRLKPISIYGDYKLESERICRQYIDKYNTHVDIVRIFSVYGNGLKKQLLWDFINKVKTAEKELTCFGTGQEKRDFINISDILLFFEILINTNSKSDIYNLGSGVSTSVQEIMELILKFYNKKLKLVFDNKKRYGNPDVLISDISKAKRMGFQPRVSIEEGIKNYVEWFKKN